MITVGLYQYDPLFGMKEKNLDQVWSAVQDPELDMLVLPEFFATGYQFVGKDEVSALSEEIPEGETTRFLTELAASKRMYVVAGLPERAGERFFNSAVLIGPGGFIGVYRKTHLFLEEKLYFDPGTTGFRVWDTEIGKVGIMICFDWFFPESMRTLALSGAEIVAHPANLVLPFCPQAMPIRCLENRVYGVTANRIGTEKRKEGEELRFIGRSLIASPEGLVLASAPEDGEVLVTAEVDPATARKKAINRLNDLFLDRRPEMYRVHGQ